LLDYFGKGGAALEVALPELGPEEKAVLDQAWHRQAQQEIQALCGACCRACAPGLQPARELAGSAVH
jgi:hypothetical protein